MADLSGGDNSAETQGKKYNDREINEWYNEVKLGRQIRICKMQEVQVNMDDKSTSIIPRNEVHILVTEEDKTGEDRKWDYVRAA